MKQRILTVVINVHKEGVWAFKAIRSATAALERFLRERPDDLVEIIVIADRSDAETMRCVLAGLDAIKHTRIDRYTTKVDLGDLGLSRNHGVMSATGKFIAFLDGDDIWGADWALRGVEALERTHNNDVDGMPCSVAHPYLNVDFGDGAFWWTQPDQRGDDFDPATFWTTNCWSSGVMAPRSVLMRHPYLPRTEGLGFEDWEWNARTMTAGILHVSVPQAVVFIRKKKDGLNADSARKRHVPAHSPYFESKPASMPLHKAVPIYEPAEDPDWIDRNWRAANQVEPALWPDARIVQHLPRFKANAAHVVPRLVETIVNKVPYTPTHVILAPCLVRGGADKRILAYASAVVRAGGHPLVFLTDRPSDEEWLKAETEEGVHVINGTELFKKAGDDATVLGLVRLIMRWRPILHVVNSRVGYSMIANYGAAMNDSGAGPFYCSLYGSEHAPGSSSRLGGASFNGWFESASKHVDHVITDNVAHALELRSMFCWEDSRLVPSPVDVPTAAELRTMEDARKAPTRLAAMRVLWASRIVKGKRLDRLLAVAKLAHERKLPILFAVAGEATDKAGRKTLAALKELPNVKASAKAFNGWATLSPGKHDVFMFTSETEGMPNVVLEAMAQGLRVITSNVGDVFTLPLDGVTTVHDADNSEAWLEAITNSHERTKPIPEWVRHHHSIAAFDNALKLAGYFKRIKRGNNANGSAAARDEVRAVDGEVEGAPPGVVQG